MYWPSMILRFLGCVATLLAPSLGAAAVEYTLMDLGPAFTVGGISATGTVVGSALTPGEQAVVLAPSRVFIEHAGRANGVAGETVVGAADQGAFRWRQATGIQFLDPAAFATGVNVTEVVTGYGDQPIDGVSTVRPRLWIGTQGTTLPTLGGKVGYADAVNSQGDIVGETQTASGAFHATLWPVGGGILDLDRRPTGFSAANAVTDHLVVGGDAQFGTQIHAFRWTMTEGMQDLGTLPGHVRSRILSINTAGVLVGSSTSPGNLDAVSKAVRVTNGVMTDLNTLVNASGWTLTDADGINDAGQIAGIGTFQGATHAWVLFPVAPVIPPPPVELLVQVHGDFNGDGVEDLAGIALDTSLYRCLAGEAACTQLPGRAVELATCDWTGDHKADLVALASDTRIFVMTDGVSWRQVPGRLQHIVARKFRSGACALDGVAADSTLWESMTGGATWQQLPGRLRVMISGDFVGGMDEQLAGAGWDTSLWWYDSAGWHQLPGYLVTLEAVPGTPVGMRGRDYSGGMWVAHTLGAWQPEDAGLMALKQSGVGR